MTSRTPRRSRDITPAPRTRRYEGGQGGRDGACALLKHQAVSERGGGPLAAAQVRLQPRLSFYAGNRRRCCSSVWLSRSYVEGR